MSNDNFNDETDAMSAYAITDEQKAILDEAHGKLMDEVLNYKPLMDALDGLKTDVISKHLATLKHGSTVTDKFAINRTMWLAMGRLMPRINDTRCMADTGICIATFMSCFYDELQSFEEAAQSEYVASKLEPDTVARDIKFVLLATHGGALSDFLNAFADPINAYITQQAEYAEGAQAQLAKLKGQKYDA